MAIKYFGVKTASGSYYLIEDHTHLFGGRPTWFVHIGENTLKVTLLIHNNLLRQDNNLKATLKKTSDLVNHPTQLTLYWGKGKGLTPISDVTSINDFLQHNIMCTSKDIVIGNINELESAFVFGTNIIVEVIQFR